MTSETARHSKHALEALHAMIYFAPEAGEQFAELDLRSFQLAYFAGRAAPMGAVGAGVVAATFYNFNPEAVADSIPRAWSIATPQDVVSARFRAADAALRRLLGDQVDSAEVAEAAQLARSASEACTPEGRPLYAGHADLDWPEEPHLQLWHAISLLREFRGDGHIMALQRAGLSGLHAVVLHTATGETMAEEFTKRSRGWSDQQWTQAQRELRDQGLLDDDNAVSEKGAVLREEIESVTDELALAPWAHLGADRVERLTKLGGGLSKTIVKAGAFPKDAFTATSSGRDR